MIDLSIVAPVCFMGKYLNRFNAFRQSGLLGIPQVLSDQYCIELHLLCGPDAPDDKAAITEGWPLPPNNIVVHRYHHADVGRKVHRFYLELCELEAASSHWWLQVDDDSSTHVDNLLLRVRSDFTNGEAVFLCSNHMVAHVLPYPFNKVVGEMGWCELDHPYASRGIEVSLTTGALLSAICANGECRELFHKLLDYDKAVCDVALTLAAKMLGIVPAPYQWLSAAPVIGHFLSDVPKNLLPPKLHHIHLIAPDLPNWGVFQSRLKGEA